MRARCYLIVALVWSWIASWATLLNLAQTQPAHAETPAHAVRVLLRTLMKRTGRSVGELERRTGLTSNMINSAYLRAKRKTVHTDPDDALKVIRALCEEVPSRLRCTAAEAIRFLELTQTPPRRYAELKPYFPDAEWRQAVQSLFESIAPVSAVPQPTLPPTRYQLRAPLPVFVGRTAELEQIRTRLSHPDPFERTNVVLITGMGGSGKTECAFVAADQLRATFPDGQIVIDIHGTSGQPRPVTDTLRGIIRALQPDALPDPRLDNDLEYLSNLYRSLTTPLSVLIILDDAIDAAYVRRLLPTPGSALLVTSRIRLPLPEAAPVELGPLAPAEARRLFLRLCSRGERYAERIVTLCGYLPLAVTLAGSTLANDGTLSLAHYLTLLIDERQRLSALSQHDAQAISVEATIQLSVDRLLAAEREALLHLGVFADSFDLPAAEGVMSIPQTQALLSRLHKHNLLQWNETAERYTLHTLVRAYALARLDRQAPVFERYAAYYLQIARQCDHLLRADLDAARQAFQRFDAERAHIDAGRQWAQASSAHSARQEMELDYTLATLEIGALRYDARQERIPHLEAALALAERLGRQRDQSRICGALGHTALKLGEITAAEQWFLRQQRSADQHGVADQQTAARIGMGAAAHARGAIAASRVHYSDALEHAQRVDARSAMIQALAGLARVDHLRGDLGAAQEAYSKQLQIAREQGDLRGIMLAYGGLGDVALDQGRLDEADRSYAHQGEQAAAIGDRHEQAEAAGGLGYVALHRQDLTAAERHFTHQQRLAESVADRPELAEARAGQAHIALRRNQPERALQLYTEQLAHTNAIGDTRETNYALCGIGDAYAALGRSDAARAAYERALIGARRIGHRKVVALVSWQLGRLLITQGETAQGLALMADRIAYKQAIGHPGAAALAAELAHLAENFPTLRERLLGALEVPAEKRNADG